MSTPILLVIDIQHGMVEGLSEWGPRSTPNFVENVTTLFKTWRSNKWPILHVNHDGGPDNIISVGFPESFAPHACATPLPSEPLFIKKASSAFVGTEVAKAIQELGDKRKIVVIGMDGGQCINSTTRHGTDLGYDMVVVGDACASYPMEDWRTGKQAGAEETHDAAMGLLTGYTKIVAAKDLLDFLEY
jgi:nicotinamidase-related amidase